MCKTDSRVTKKLQGGTIIDAPFPDNLILAYKVLVKEGQFCQHRDFLRIVQQCDNQLTTVKYNKTVLAIDSETNEKYGARYFTITIPDRYIPTSKVEKLPEGVIREEKDI